VTSRDAATGEKATLMGDLVPVERDTSERRAEFIRSNAVDAADDARAVEAVRQLGLDPAIIPHQPPDDQET
jgi:hypothetical protein